MKELLINVTVIVFLTTMLDMLLPGGKMQPFVRMVMGLFILVTILSPILNLIRDDAWLDSWILTENLTSDGESIMTLGKQWQKQNEDNTLTVYKNKLERQISSLVYMLDDVEECQSRIDLAMDDKLGEVAQIKQVTVYVKSAVPNEGLPEKIQKMLCGYYDLDSEMVEVQLE